MNDHLFDAVTRGATEAVSRRNSLRLLGVASLASAFASPGIAKAGKGGKKAKKPCKQQKAQCRIFFAEFCAKGDNPPACEASLFPCCEHFGRCSTGAGIDCIFKQF